MVVGSYACEMASEEIPAPTVGRLPAYLRAAIELAGDEMSHVSSERLATMLGHNAATVRRDLGALGISGTRGVGYDVKHLVYEISVELGVNQEWPVVVVGAGNLGRALANYAGMAQRGFPVRALVDVNPDLVGASVAGVLVSGLNDLPDVVAANGVAVGVIATPADGAQEAADALVAAGITSILNFTVRSVVVPDTTIVRRVDLATELQILSFYQQRGQGVASGTGLPLDVDVSPEGFGDNVERCE